jgi:hypothetical protein
VGVFIRAPGRIGSSTRPLTHHRFRFRVPLRLPGERPIGKDGSVASFRAEQEFAGKASFPANSGGHFEEFVDEPILTTDATPAQPPHLAVKSKYSKPLRALNLR